MSTATGVASSLDTGSEQFRTSQEAMLAKLAQLEAEHAKALAGGGEKYVKRHHDRGKLLPRERIELLIDPDSPFLELSPLAGYGTDYPVGGSVVTGIGVIEDVECVIVASDPTVRGGATNPIGLKKSFRANDIALANRLPLVNLIESGGADLQRQQEIFIPGGRVFRDLTRLSAAGIPTISLVFGNSTAGGAYVPGMSDHVVMIKERSKVFLAGPPLVKMATGEESDDESLGGADMHATSSGLADYYAVDEPDAIRIGRRIVARLNWRKLGPPPAAAPDEPLYDPEELLGIVPSDLRVPFDPREVVARVVDGSRFDEFKPRYGTSLVTGWAHLHGYPVGVLANAQGVLFSEESQKAAQFIQLANAADTSLIFLHHTTGYMVGSRYEQQGIIKHGAMMINAVSNSEVPHISLLLGASYGAGNYGMAGRAYDPRFLFAWPSAKAAVMGPTQLAGVLSIVARQSAAAAGRDYDEDADQVMRTMVENQIESESLAMALSGQLFDDGVIDPRDTRTVLGFCLSAIHSGPVAGTSRYGVFRM
jgi:acyl-CoA carboxylase subunit beta